MLCSKSIGKIDLSQLPELLRAPTVLISTGFVIAIRWSKRWNFLIPAMKLQNNAGSLRLPSGNESQHRFRQIPPR
jgi:hypothetical protein